MIDKKNKTFFRFIAILSAVAFLGTASPAIAFAVTVTSTDKYLGAAPNGASVYSRSSAQNNSARASSFVYATKAVPTGYLAAQGRLYLQNGVLCKSASLSYSTSTASSKTSTVWGNCGLDYYYGFGRGGYFNGSNYNISSNNTTPYISLP